jgi:protein SCO1/2
LSLCLALFGAGCSKAPEQRTFTLQGQIQSLDPARTLVTVKHEEIKGFMPAMIMMYRVEPFSLTAGLQPGDRIEFALDAKSYTIHDVRRIERGK